MNRSRIIVFSALASLCLTATPALAGQHRGGGRACTTAVPRGAVRPSAPRAAVPFRGGGASRVSSAGPRYAFAPRGYTSRPFIQSPRVYAAQSRGVYGRPSGRAVGRSVPRVNRGYYYAPVRYYRPYYAFRPRFSIGFGIWAGYPIAFSSFYYGGYSPYAYGYAPYYPAYRYAPYPYPYPYPYAYPYPSYGPPAGYGYPMAPPEATSPTPAYPSAGAAPTYDDPNAPQGTVIARPGSASGSISFEITPSTAEVFVDDAYVGRVSDLGPMTQPLALTPGRHHVEIRAGGYHTLSMDVDIISGQVIPYRGQLLPVR